MKLVTSMQQIYRQLPLDPIIIYQDVQADIPTSGILFCNNLELIWTVAAVINDVNYQHAKSIGRLAT